MHLIAAYYAARVLNPLEAARMSVAEVEEAVRGLKSLVSMSSTMCKVLLMI